MRPKHSKARESYIDKYTKLLRSRIESIQDRYYSTLLENFVSELQLDSDGKIKSNDFNRRLVRSLTKIHNEFADEEFTPLLVWLISQLEGLNKLNRKYFDAMSEDFSKSAAEKIEEERFKDLGYEDEKIKKDSFLYDVAQGNTTLAVVKASAIRAVGAGLTLVAFRKIFRTLIKGTEEKSGALLKDIYGRLGETFTIQDRELTKAYSSDLDLNFFIFNGPDLVGSRDFCLKRKGSVFTRAEVLAWASLPAWKGRNDGYNPFRDVGGHNCVDVLDPITRELAEIERPDLAQSE